MNDAAEQLPDDLNSAFAALAEERVRRIAAEAEAMIAKAEAASAKALVSHSEALIARLKLAIGGYNPLFKVDRDSVPLSQAICWAHSCRKFFVMADIATNDKRSGKAAPISPSALEAVKWIDALFDIEREINGLAAEQRLERRRQHSLLLS